MKLCEIYKIADELAPKALSDEYCEKFGTYDNSGVLVDAGEEITGVLCSLDLSFAAIDAAIAKKANLIITHHPAIYGKIGAIQAGAFEPLGEKLVRALKNGISVISMHLNLDCAPSGIDECLAQGICRSAGVGTRSFENLAVMHPLSQGGYGRTYDVPATAVSTLAENMKKVFSTKRVESYEKKTTIKRVASFCGAGADEAAVQFAAEQGADVIVSSDFKHHVITLALEKGLSVIALTHYASENYGFEQYYQKIRASVSLPCAYHTDGELL
jgi:dinuclear metal center YbgI/SA1388 family protein